MEETITADILDTLDADSASENVWTERPEREPVNLAVVDARETVRLTYAKFKNLDGEDMELLDNIERADILAKLAARNAADGVRDDNDEQCALALHFSEQCIHTLGAFAERPTERTDRAAMR